MKKKNHSFLYESEGLAKIGMKLTKRQHILSIFLGWTIWATYIANIRPFWSYKNINFISLNLRHRFTHLSLTITQEFSWMRKLQPERLNNLTQVTWCQVQLRISRKESSRTLVLLHTTTWPLSYSQEWASELSPSAVYKVKRDLERWLFPIYTHFLWSRCLQT